jgi:hypothetical protein
VRDPLVDFFFDPPNSVPAEPDRARKLVACHCEVD